MTYAIFVRIGVLRVPTPIWEGTERELIKAFPKEQEPLPVWRWVKDAVMEPPQQPATFTLHARPDRNSPWLPVDVDPRLV
jgi:hypothetical protein